MNNGAHGRDRQDGPLTKLGWALRFAWQSGRRLTLVSGALTVVEGLTPLLFLYVMKLIVDTVAAGLLSSDRDAVLQQLTGLVIIAAGVVLVERALGTIRDLVKALHAQRATDRIYRILHAKSVDVDLAFYEQPEYYDALHRAQQEAPYRPSRILESVFRLGQSAVSLVAIGGLLLMFHWSIPFLLFLAGVPGLLIRFVYARKLYLAGRRQTPAERLALYFHAILTGDAHAKEVRLFDLGGVFASRFATLRDEIRSEKSSLMRRRSVADLAAHVVGVGPIFALFGVLAFRVVQGLLSIGDLVMFYQAMQRAQANLDRFSQAIGDLYENHLFLTDVHAFLSLQPVTRDTRPTRPVPRPLLTGIDLRGVVFRYPQSDRMVLDSISLHIRPGEHIALVGENGCGKTTLVKLMARLYDPTGGAITLDGCDLREFPVRELRRALSVVFQDYAKYNVTALDNIWFGAVDGPPDQARIQAAAEVAGIHAVIAGLPHSYATILGRKFAAGAELSIGEWQKIALARAFLRDAEIVILDEPTSALDARAEAELFERFLGLFHDRTAILVSHRLSTVKMVDRIYFMENGRIVESGSHDDLIDRGGSYAEMFEIQARRYR
jgi:ATP-binding cassette, subfamily B, bacterial